MTTYYLRLAFLSIKRNYILSALMIAAIGLGIGASMTTITVNYAMSGNPIDEKNDRLFAVQLDNWNPSRPYREPNVAPDQLTYLDATALMASAPAEKQAAMTKVFGVIEPTSDDATPFEEVGRATYSDFFSMFNTPFLYGGAWERNADETRQLVTVIGRQTNDRVFGGENSVGKYIKIAGLNYQVVGVLDDWQVTPKFYDLTNGAFNETEQYYIPFTLVAAYQLDRAGNTNCWKNSDEDGFQGFLNSECIWIQFWAELPNKESQENYLSFLNRYVSQQKDLGRFPRPMNNHIQNVDEWLSLQNVVPDSAQIVMWLSVMFLFVCLLNTVGLLLTKFSSKASEIGLRRALGASKLTLFSQHLIESSIIGMAGGFLGLFLAWLGLMGIKVLFGDYMQKLAVLDLTMIFTAILLAILSAIAAGLYPTWRACNIQPAIHLKTQ